MVSVPEENESDMDNWSSQQFDFFYLQNNHIRQRRFVLEKADNNPDKFTRNQEKLRSLTGRSLTDGRAHGGWRNTLDWIA